MKFIFIQDFQDVNGSDEVFTWVKNLNQLVSLHTDSFVREISIEFDDLSIDGMAEEFSPKEFYKFLENPELKTFLIKIKEPEYA